MSRIAPTAVIHPSAIIDDGAIIGERTRIWHFCHVMGTAVIGDDCVLGQNVFVDRNVIIGKRCKIQNNVSVYRGVTLENEVFVGPSAVFTNDKTPRAGYPKNPSTYPRTMVRHGASIGANATIVCGIEIGEGAFIAAGSVVTGNVYPYKLVKGNPAKLYADICRCGAAISKPWSTEQLALVCEKCMTESERALCEGERKCQ